MKRKITGLLLVLVMVITIFGVAPAGVSAATIWTVDDDGPADFSKIQDGIDAAVSGDTVLVADGIYYENITLKDGVQVLGAGADVCTIDGGGSGSVVTAIGVGPTTVLDGFTITNGSAERGGGVYCDSSSPTIRNNRIINNHAVQSEHPEHGGGIYCGNGSNAKILNNIIENNSANNHGGGIFFRFSSPTIKNNLIIDNVGGLVVAGGQGGGIAGAGDSSAIICNNLIVSNSAVMLQPGVLEVGGGGIALDNFANATIINNTIDGNSTEYGYGGGILCDWNASPIILNNIVVNSLDGEGIWVSSVGANPVIDYNNIWNNADGNYGRTAIPGLNDISEDPMFLNPAGDDYHLQDTSPCIDAGDNSAPSLPSTDFEGDPRIIDGDGDAVAVVDMGADEYVPLPDDEIGVFLPSNGGWYLDYNGNGAWDGPVTDKVCFFGGSAFTPVTGDWNGDGVTEIGVFLPSNGRWYLDYNGNGTWDGPVTDRLLGPFGSSAFIPVTGNWDGL